MDKFDRLVAFVAGKARGAKTSANNTYLYDATRRHELLEEAKLYEQIKLVLASVTPGKKLKLLERFEEMEETK